MDELSLEPPSYDDCCYNRETLQNYIPPYEDSEFDLIIYDNLPSFFNNPEMDNNDSITTCTVGCHHKSSFENGIAQMSVRSPNAFQSYLDHHSIGNIQKLPKLDLPIEVNVTLTKNEFQYDIQNEILDSSATFYSPGDTIYGYVTFENKCETNIPFEMLLVSFEGEIGVIDHEAHTQLKKTILEMYDFEASSCTYSGYNNKPSKICDNVLRPGEITTRRFKFKIPTYMLDNNCRYLYLEHLKLPPTFGFDPFDLANGIHQQIDPHLGYLKPEREGAPHKYYDMALPGEFCKYFINFSLVGPNFKTMYKPFYPRFFPKDSKFISIKRHKYFIGIKRNETVYAYGVCYGSTFDQLEFIEQEILEDDNAMDERIKFNKLGISDFDKQNEMIYRGKSKNACNYCVTWSKSTKPTISDFYKQTLQFELRNLFKTVKGNLQICVNMKHNFKIKNIRPVQINKKSGMDTFVSAINSSPTSEVILQLEYKSKAGSKEMGLPSYLFVRPTLVAVDIQSPHSLPFIVDQNFILQDQNKIEEIFNKFYHLEKFLEYLTTVYESRLLDYTTYIMKGVAKVKYKEIRFPNVFKVSKINLKPSDWTFDSNLQSYQSTIKIPIELDVESMCIVPKTITPSFQTCLFGRLYKLQLDVSPKGGRLDSVFLPIDVE